MLRLSQKKLPNLKVPMAQVDPWAKAVRWAALALAVQVAVQGCQYRQREQERLQLLRERGQDCLWPRQDSQLFDKIK
jgi:sugar/nucleoside kinase (ribokinase family)